jgi:hypothetical protein
MMRTDEHDVIDEHADVMYVRLTAHLTVAAQPGKPAASCYASSHWPAPALPVAGCAGTLMHIYSHFSLLALILFVGKSIACRKLCLGGCVVLAGGIPL